MKKTLIVLVIMVIVVGCGLLVVRQHNRPGKYAPSFYGYNPNYADAIKQKKPELCKKIAYALKSTPTDFINKINGDAAIRLCEGQARDGAFLCECDSDRTLNEMKVR